METKLTILSIINFLFWIIIFIYHQFYQISGFMLGMAISFSISTLIGMISSLESLFVSIFLAWGLYLLALWEGTNSPFIAGCATALTLGATIGFVISRPLR